MSGRRRSSGRLLDAQEERRKEEYVRGFGMRERRERFCILELVFDIHKVVMVTMKFTL